MVVQFAQKGEHLFGQISMDFNFLKIEGQASLKSCVKHHFFTFCDVLGEFHKKTYTKLKNRLKSVNL